MTKTAPISVVIPAFNCGRYLSEAMDSLLSQSLKAREIIVVDDGSTDDTEAVLRRYQEHILYVRQSNLGVSVARNRGIQLASADFIALLDADDICAPERLEKQWQALQASSGAIACLCGHWIFGEGRKTQECPGRPSVAALDVVDFWTHYEIQPSTLLFDRSRAAGLQFPPEQTTGEDMVFLGMLRSRGTFTVVPEMLYGYRSRPGSAVFSHSESQSFQQRFGWARQHWREYWPQGTFEELEHRFWRSLAEQCARAYWARDRARFTGLRSFLRREWPCHLEPAPERQWRWYPSWLWAVKRFIDRLANGKPQPTR